MIKQILLLFIFWSGLFYAQTDSILSALEFYPLHIGDYWEYQVEQEGVFPDEFGSWISYKSVVGDTIMPSNNKYFIINEGILDSTETKKLLRIDSSSGFVYEYKNENEILVDDIVENNLTLDLQDSVSNYRIINFYSKNLFGLEIETKHFVQNYVSTANVTSWELSKNIGLVQKWHSEVLVYAINYKYELIYAKVNGIELGIKTDIIKDSQINKKFYLAQNYPNPFNPITLINYSLNKASHIKLVVTNLLGQEIISLVDDYKPSGSYNVEFNSINISSGVYFYHLITERNTITKKMLILK